MAKIPTSNIEVIEYCYNTLTYMQKNILSWNNDKAIIELYNIMINSLYSEIHDNRMLVKTEENEKIIRNLIARYVIGFNEKGKLWLGAIPLIENKINYHTCKRKKDIDIISQYVSLHDDFMAIAAFRSFKHFCLYMEQDWDKKVWKPQLENFEGWFYYANKMALDGSVQFIEKQMATGRGKSLSDCFHIAWNFGIDKNRDIIKVFGNKYNCGRATDTISTLMTNKKYAKVFPFYDQFNCKQDSIFSTCKIKDGELKINGSTQPVSFLTVGKESKISGTRAMFLYLDDITQAEDSSSIKMHDKDIATYLEVWARRKWSNNNFYIVASGTTYSIYDILSWLKKRFGGDNAVVDTKFKFTSVAKSNRIVKDGMSVFVCIPALDYKTDLSTYEEEYPTEQLRKMREDDYETFMAMEQQQPCKPRDNPFYMSLLQSYEELPDIDTNGRTNSCQAFLDTKRKGADYCAMPIFTKIGELHYLVDAVYDNRPMKECYGSIIAKIVQHHITKLYIENNINEGLKTLLDKLLYERNVFFCEIIEKYHGNVKKDVRIANAEADIKSLMVFPKFGLYARSSVIGQAMDELYGYSYIKKVEHDDFTDALAGYDECFIADKYKQISKISLFSR